MMGFKHLRQTQVFMPKGSQLAPTLQRAALARQWQCIDLQQSLPGQIRKR
ncbi:hypothetical protein [Stenotrophomonas sp. B1-1]|nr:hypothetical protein [Stenotrophomonas sp. B1-1]